MFVVETFLDETVPDGANCINQTIACAVVRITLKNQTVDLKRITVNYGYGKDPKDLEPQWHSSLRNF